MLFKVCFKKVHVLNISLFYLSQFLVIFYAIAIFSFSNVWSVCYLWYLYTFFPSLKYVICMLILLPFILKWRKQMLFIKISMYILYYKYMNYWKLHLCNCSCHLFSWVIFQLNRSFDFQFILPCKMLFYITNVYNKFDCKKC